MNPFGSNLVPLGLQDDRLRFVDEVAPGLACGCICPSCEQPLIARSNSYEGRKRRPHFAHYRKGECPGGFESAIHKTAKELLATGHLTLPGLHIGEPLEHRVEIQSASLEVSITGLPQRRQPDVLAEVTGRYGAFTLLVEVCNKHPVDPDKEHQYSEAGLACIEIDVRDIPADVFAERASFEACVRDAARRGRWVSLSPNAIQCLIGLPPVRIVEASSTTRDVPFTSRHGDPMAWRVEVQAAEEWQGQSWQGIELELELVTRDETWCDSAGNPLPYRAGLYVRGSTLNRFKHRLVPIIAERQFPGAQLTLDVVALRGAV